jgi:uncharacterized LabA/DUF88 family protein
MEDQKTKRTMKIKDSGTPSHSPFYTQEKLAVFIDGSNLYASAKALDFDIDYRLLLKWAANQGRLVRAFYYTILMEDQEYSPVRPLVDWLDYNGYTMVTKPAREYTDSQGRRKVKGSIDVELAIDMMEIAESVDHIMIFSGDGDFRRLIEAVQRKGVRVTVVSTIKSSPPMVADELRRQADYFLDLDLLADHIQREGYTPTDDDEYLEPVQTTPARSLKG